MPRRDFWGTYWDPPVQHLWGTVSLLASRHRLFAYHSFARKIFFCCTLRLWVDIFLRMRLGAHDAVKHGQLCVSNPHTPGGGFSAHHPVLLMPCLALQYTNPIEAE